MDARYSKRWIYGFFALISFFSSFAKAADDGFVFDPEVLDQDLPATLEKVSRAAALGAEHFNIPVLLCQKDTRSTVVRFCRDEEAVREKFFALAGELRARNFSVGLLVFLTSDDSSWRGEIVPSDFNAWGKSYLEQVLKLARWSSESGVQEFMAGTELNRLYLSQDKREQDKRTRYWRATLGELRKTFPVLKIFIVANWDQWDQIPFWESSDYIALSAYYPLADHLKSDHSLEALARRWGFWAEKLVALSKAKAKPLYFSEVGYSSMVSAASEPWRYYPPTSLDLELQSRLFEAFGAVWSQAGISDRLERFMVWALTTTQEPSQDFGFSVFGKPAEQALERVFRARRNSPNAGKGICGLSNY